MAALTGQQMRDYIVNTSFKRTDKDAELYQALTDVIRQMRHEFPFQEIHADALTTDTISVLGDYKIDVDAEFGGLISTVIMVDGTEGITLTKISKSEFDRRYPNPSDASYRGYPETWCLFGNQVLIGPPPQATTYTYRMSYAKDQAVEITAGTTSVPFSDKYRKTLKNGVLSVLYADLDNDEAAGKFQALYENDKYKAIQRERVNAGVYEAVAYRDF